MAYSYYGTLAEADTYFSERLHSEAWSESDAADRPKALDEATQLIDALNYRGVKHALWLIMYSYDTATESYEKILVDPPNRDAIIAADATQPLEFPRGQDDTAPTEIEWACYETALALLEGFDPEEASERLGILRQGYSSVRTTYDGGSSMQEYLVYGIPTARVWRWLKPRLTDSQIIRISRAD